MSLLRALPLVALAACGSTGDALDAGSDVVYGHKSLDASTPDVAEADVPKVPLNRMQPHGSVVLAAPHVRVIYIGQEGVDGSQSFDAYMTWLVTAVTYWGAILAQYGVGYGTFDGSTRIDASAFFTPGMVSGGVIVWTELDTRVAQVIHQPVLDAGVEAGGDAGDASAQLPPIPPADAYVFFLPDNVNVDLGHGQLTCQQAYGYHSFDGTEPYSIIPPCGRRKLVVSHEMAEMVTDPQPGLGWYSDQDLQNAGGEIGDLCNYLTAAEGNQVTGLWSNKDGDCEPPP